MILNKGLTLLLISLLAVACSKNPLGNDGNNGNTHIDTNFLNQGIKTQDVSGTVQKNLETDITLPITVNGFTAVSCDLTDLQNIEITNSCSCVSNICSVRVKGSLNFSGLAQAKFLVVDNNGTKSNKSSLNLTVTPFNYAPLINSLNDQSTLANTLVSQSINFYDIDSPLNCSFLSAVSSDQGVIPDVNINFSGTYPICQINVTPNSNVSGIVQITVTGNDNDTTDPKSVSSSFNVTVSNPPSEPLSLVATAGSGSIDLSWSVPAIGSTPITYNVFRKTSSTSYALLSSGVSGTTFSDTSAAIGVTYFYSLSSTNSAGTSSTYSNEVQGQLIGSFSITGATTTNNSQITWGTSAGASSYALMIGTSSGSYSQTLSGQSSPATLSTLSSGTTYYIKAIASNAFTSVSSNEIQVQPIAAFATPTVSVSGANALTLCWSAVSGASAYSVSYGTTTGSYSTTAACTSSPCSITGLSGGTYYFRVTATNSVGFGSTQYSAEVSATTLGSFSITSSSSAATTFTTGSATLGWGASSGANSYDVLYKTGAGTYSTYSNLTALTETLASLTSGQSYTFKIVAKNGSGTLDSNEVTLNILGLFTDNFDFGSSLTYTAGTDGEISGGKGKLIQSNLTIEKTNSGTGTNANNLFDNYAQKDANLTIGTDKITMSSGTTATYTSKALDKTNSTVAITGLSYLSSLPFGKELSLTAETGYGSSVTNFTTNLISLWRFNDTVYNGTAGEMKDSKGSNHGKLFVAPVVPTDGAKFGKAAYFSGASMMQVPSSSTLDNTDKLTISTWVYPTVMDGQPRGIISKRTDVGIENSYSIFFYTGNHLAIDIEGNDNRFFSNTTFSANQWYHIVVVYDGNQTFAQRVKLYVNGVLDKTAGETATVIGAHNSSLWFGALNSAYSYQYQGYIDETALWKDALDATKVQELYRRGANKIKLQVRTCDAVSGMDCSGTISPWTGFDGTNASYFTELENNSDPINKTGSVLSSPLSIVFNAFTALNSWVTSYGKNRYVQVQAVLSSSSTTLFPDIQKISITPAVSYALSSIVSANNFMVFNKINSITVTQTCADANGNTLADDVTYALSFDNGGSYVYWNGSAWASSTGLSTGNTKAQIEALTNTQYALATGNGKLLVKAYLSSNGTQGCEVDNVQVSGVR